MIDYSG